MKTRIATVTTAPVHPFGNVALGGHPDYKKNLERTEHADQTVACCFCGRKAGGAGIYVYLLDTSEFAKLEDYANEPDDTNLGLYPVGSDCAKKLRKLGVITYDRNGKRVGS